jgi:O-antigen ligase
MALTISDREPAEQNTPSPSGSSPPTDGPRTQRVITGILGGSIVFLQIPTLIGHLSVSTPLVLLVFIGAILWLQPKTTAIPDQFPLIVLAMFVATILVAIVRGSEAGVYVNTPHAALEDASYVAFATLGIVAITSATDDSQRHDRLIALVLAPSIYASANVLAYLAHLHSATVQTQGIATVQPATLLGDLGIHIDRVQFPFSTGVNNTGIMAGAGMASALVLWRFRSAPRWLLALCLFGCLFVLLWGDSRVALIFGLVVFLYAATSRRFSLARAVAVSVPFLPLLVLGGATLLNSYVGAFFSRGPSGSSFASVDGRTYIWSPSWSAFLHASRFHQLFGWGTNGQGPSGAAIGYAYRFGTGANTDPAQYTTHNLSLQTLLETGVVGLVLLTALVWIIMARATRELRRRRDPFIVALAASVAVIVLSGATEAIPTSSTSECLGELLLAGGAIIAITSVRFVKPLAHFPGRLTPSPHHVHESPADE